MAKIKYESAIPVNSISEEKQWIIEHHPTFRIYSQRLESHYSNHFDLFVLTNDNGEKIEVVFDINLFYGKHYE